MGNKVKIRKDDEVVVLTGKDKGRKGKVLRVIPKESRIVVQGINVAKQHKRASAMGNAGIFENEMPMHISNVALADPKDGSPVKIGYKFLKDGKKVRISRKTGEEI